MAPENLRVQTSKECLLIEPANFRFRPIAVEQAIDFAAAQQSLTHSLLVLH